MALTNTQIESAAAAVLVLIYPPYHVAVDAVGGRLTEAQAVAALEILIAAAEGGGIDDDLRPFLRLFNEKYTTHGALQAVIAALQVRSVALAP